VASRLAIASQKGGVGKTTTAVNLAVELASHGKRVLLVDCDHQGDATAAMGLGEFTSGADVFTTLDFILGQRPFTPCRDVLPGTEVLVDLDLELLRRIPFDAPVRRFGDALASVDAAYDVVIADCPPTVGLTAVNAVVGCKNVLISIQLLPGSLRAVPRLVRLIEGLRSEKDPAIRVLGLVGTFFDGVSRHPRQALEAARQLPGLNVFSTVIHRSTDVAAGVLGNPVVLARPVCRGAMEYRELAREVFSQLGESRSAVLPATQRCLP